MKKILAIFVSIIILAGCKSGKNAINTTIPESYKADEEKIVDMVVGPDAYKDLPNLIEEINKPFAS